MQELTNASNKFPFVALARPLYCRGINQHLLYTCQLLLFASNAARWLEKFMHKWKYDGKNICCSISSVTCMKELCFVLYN